MGICGCGFHNPGPLHGHDCKHYQAYLDRERRKSAEERLRSIEERLDKLEKRLEQVAREAERAGRATRRYK